MKVVVIGAGLAGLAAGLQLARHGHNVTLVERDRAPAPQRAVDAFTSWHRPGTSQARLHHTFSPRARLELECHIPDALRNLLELGIVERDLSVMVADTSQPEDAQLTFLCARRPIVEWVLRQAAESTADLRLVVGNPATQLVWADPKRTVLSGVRCGVDMFPADFVVDAGGRRSPVRGWLQDATVRLPAVQREPCGIAYSSRYFRLRDRVELPSLRGPVIEMGNLGYMGYAMGPADSRTYSIVLAFPTHDGRLRVLRRPAAWDAAAQLIDRTKVFVDHEVGEPLADPAPMYGLENTLAPWFVDCRPVVRNLVAIGDAWLTTDPLFGWGASFALAHGFGLADAVVEHGDDVDSALAAFHARHHEEAEQRFALSCEDDRARLAQWSGLTRRTRDEVEREALMFGLTRVARTDPTVMRALLRRQGLLALPNDVWRDQATIDRAKAALADRPFDPNRTTPGPSRGALLDHIDAAIARGARSAARSARI